MCKGMGGEAEAEEDIAKCASKWSVFQIITRDGCFGFCEFALE
jgi:hypothetical protein